jgi:hypothetical protein
VSVSFELESGYKVSASLSFCNVGAIEKSKSPIDTRAIID